MLNLKEFVNKVLKPYIYGLSEFKLKFPIIFTDVKHGLNETIGPESYGYKRNKIKVKFYIYNR